MRRQRIIFLLVALAAVLAIPAVGTTAPRDQVRGPGCGDITFWNWDQSDVPQYTHRTPTGGTGPATVYSSITTAKPSCTGFVYTVTVVYTDSAQQQQTVSQTVDGDGTTSLFSFTYSPPGEPSQVCVSATSSRDGHVVDAAPDSGCATLILDGASSGGSGLN